MFDVAADESLSCCAEGGWYVVLVDDKGCKRGSWRDDVGKSEGVVGWAERPNAHVAD